MGENGTIFIWFKIWEQDCFAAFAIGPAQGPGLRPHQKKKIPLGEKGSSFRS